MAIIRTLQLELRSVEIRSDSAYCIRGFLKHRQEWRKNGWRRRGREIKNADLWRQIDQLLEERGANEVAITKVKGHASRQDVRTGRVLAMDKNGNDAADALAVTGAGLCHRRAAEREAQRQRFEVGIAVQRMMLEIVLARAQHQRGVPAAANVAWSDEGDGESEIIGSDSSDSASRSEQSASRSESGSETDSSGTSATSTQSLRTRTLRRTRGRAAPAAQE